MLRFGTWNLWNFGRDGVEPRFDTVAAVIRAMNLDVLAVQEVCCDPTRFQALAEAAGMTTTLPDGRVAIEPGGHGFGVGLMWNPDRVRPQPTTLRRFPTEFWHGLVHLGFVVTATGTTATFGSYHASPYERPRRDSEALLVAGRITGSSIIDAGLVGADWNAVGESERLDVDPYADRPWKPVFVHCCEWDTDEHGSPVRWRASRTAARNLHAGGLVDVVRHLYDTGRDHRRADTTGHHPVDPQPCRRIDTVRATATALAAVVGHYIAGCTSASGASAAALDVLGKLRELSDHLPSITVVDPAALPVQAR